MKKASLAALFTLLSSSAIAATFPPPIPQFTADCAYEGKTYSPGSDIKMQDAVKTCQRNNKDGSVEWVENPKKARLSVRGWEDNEKSDKPK